VRHDADRVRSNGTYLLLAGMVGGGFFAGLYHWRGGIVAPFAAHLVLNLVEFIDASVARGEP